MRLTPRSLGRPGGPGFRPSEVARPGYLAALWRRSCVDSIHSPTAAPSRSADGTAAADAAAKPTHHPGGVEELAANLRGQVLRPGDAQFDAFGLPLNRRFAGVRPGGVAVRDPRRRRSRPHLVAGKRPAVRAPFRRAQLHGLFDQRGLVVSTGRLNSVRYQAQSDRIVVGGGALNTDVAAALKPYDVMFPTGQCRLSVSPV